MHAIEFITELSEQPVLTVPREVAAQLPKRGQARIIVLTSDESGNDTEWRQAGYEQFMRDDAPEDAIYDGVP